MTTPAPRPDAAGDGRGRRAQASAGARADPPAGSGADRRTWLATPDGGPALIASNGPDGTAPTAPGPAASAKSGEAAPTAPGPAAPIGFGGAGASSTAGAAARFAAAEAQARLSAAALRPPPPDPIHDPVNAVSDWNVANALTLLRILLVPVFAVVLFTDGGHNSGWRIAAWGVFAVASVTDRIDGELARRRHLVTELGKLADPIADKALIGMALIGLSVLNDLAWWVTVVILARELAVTGLRFWVIRQGVIPASRGGKVKTVLQGVAIGLYILPLSGAWHAVAALIMAAALVLTVVTGVDYAARAISLRRRGRTGRPVQTVGGTGAP